MTAQPARPAERGYHQDYIARIRYENTLPPPPGAPKLLNIPTEGLNYYTSAAFASRMARQQPLNIEADAELGMPIDLVGMPGIFDGDESGKSHFAMIGLRLLTCHVQPSKLLWAYLPFIRKTRISYALYQNLVNPGSALLGTASYAEPNTYPPRQEQELKPMQMLLKHPSSLLRFQNFEDPQMYPKKIP